MNTSLADGVTFYVLFRVHVNSYCNKQLLNPLYTLYTPIDVTFPLNPLYEPGSFLGGPESQPHQRGMAAQLHTPNAESVVYGLV